MYSPLRKVTEAIHVHNRFAAAVSCKPAPRVHAADSMNSSDCRCTRITTRAARRLGGGEP